MEWQNGRVTDQREIEHNHEIVALNQVQAIWEWVKELRKIQEKSGSKVDLLLQMCRRDKMRFNPIDVRFPSAVVKEIVRSFERTVIQENTAAEIEQDEIMNVELQGNHAIAQQRYESPFHNADTFSWAEFISYIYDNNRIINSDNVEGIFVALIDTALYHAYEILSSISSGRLVFQLNACIILDAMTLKPDITFHGDLHDISELLRVVVQKADTRIDILDEDIVWTIAMLSYKTQRYGRASRYFSRYIELTEQKTIERRSSDQLRQRYMYARIALGYCYEKQEIRKGSGNSQEANRDYFFTKAIEHFKRLLSEIQDIKDNVSTIDGSIDPAKLDDYIVEIHHGLGHFYNERAVFGESPVNPARDILAARQHMRFALNDRPEEFASCYGSLFHEYRDYGAALDVFRASLDNPKLRNNKELLQELYFYIAQAEALYTTEDETGKSEESLRNESDRLLTEFEEYCRKTYNYDGIIHARIFRARSYLRRLPFTDRGPQRNNRKTVISSLYDDLTELTLSNYAAMSIRNEYEKAKYMLRVYRSLYWDDDFMWRMEDIQYNLAKFIDLMPEGTRSVSDEELKGDASQQKGLYAITVDKLDIWCISVNGLPDTLRPEKGGIVKCLRDVTNTAEVYRKMESNEQTNYIVVFPPDDFEHITVDISDDGLWVAFKQEVLSLATSRSNLCFIIPKHSASLVQNWIRSDPTSQRRNIASVSVEDENEAVRYAFCFRAFSIMRNELLQPKPLFTLVPTHLSLAYDYQVGQSLELLMNAMLDQNCLGSNKTNMNSVYRRLGEAYKQKGLHVNQNVFVQKHYSIRCG